MGGGGVSNHKFGQQIQNKAIKSFFCVHKNTPNLAVESHKG